MWTPLKVICWLSAVLSCPKLAADEHFRFYRLLDIHLSFFVKSRWLSVVACPALTDGLIKHPHLEWDSLNDEERATKSKKNFDIFYTRWHHGQSLLVTNYQPGNRWFWP